MPAHDKAPHQVIDLVERRERFIAQIGEFVRRRNAADALSRPELGGLPSLARLQSQRQSILDNIAHYYAHNSNADVALGVVALVTFYSDNNAGCCTMSVETMARYLSRTRRAVQEAIGRCERDQIIFSEAVPGATTRRWPYVYRGFGDTKDPLAWLLEVRAPSVEPGKPGRPRRQNAPEASFAPIPGHENTPAGNCAPISFDASAPKNAGLSEIPAQPASEVKFASGVKLAAPDTTKEKKELRGPRGASLLAVKEGGSAPAVLSEEAFEEFHRLYSGWGAQGAIDKAQTDARLQSIVDPYLGYGAETLSIAFAEAMNVLRDKHDAGAHTGSMASYFAKVLGTRVFDTERRLSQHRALVDADTQAASAEVAVAHEIGRKRLQAFDAAVEQSARARDRRGQSPHNFRYAPDEAGRQAFASDARLTTIAKVAVSGVHGNQILRAVANDFTEATPADVETALVEISDNFKRQVEAHQDVSLKEILESATSACRRLVAFRTYGTLEQQIDGAVAKHAGQAINAGWAAISQSFLDHLFVSYPRAAEGVRYPDRLIDTGVLYSLQGSEPHRRYGRGLQQQVEAAVEKRFADFHAQADRVRADEEKRWGA